jgi:hypothetical protein
MSGYYLSLLGNQKIKWETNKTTNIGFDVVLFKGLTASFSWFNRESSGVLYDTSNLLFSAYCFTSGLSLLFPLLSRQLA